MPKITSAEMKFIVLPSNCWASFKDHFAFKMRFFLRIKCQQQNNYCILPISFLGSTTVSSTCISTRLAYV